jgi:hypothetical protein
MRYRQVGLVSEGCLRRPVGQLHRIIGTLYRIFQNILTANISLGSMHGSMGAEEAKMSWSLLQIWLSGDGCSMPLLSCSVYSLAVGRDMMTKLSDKVFG